MDKTTLLFNACLDLLNDRCPKIEKAQLCRYFEDDNGYGCDLCWSNYVFDIMNGDDPGHLYTDKHLPVKFGYTR